MDGRCGQCGGLLSVEKAFQEWQVPCPHCGHVPPLPEAVATDEPPLELVVSAPPEEPESILSVSEGPEDALFDGPAPQVALAPDPGSETVPALPVSAAEVAAHPPLAQESAWSTAAEVSSTWLAFEPPAWEGEGSVALVAAGPAGPDTLVPVAPAVAGEPDRAEPELVLTDQPYSRSELSHPAPRAMGRGLYTALVLVPLISYALLATIAVIILYLREPAPQVPFEVMPDVEGELKGAKHQKPGPVSTYERIQPEVALPNRLRVGLGETIRLGDVEVTPLRVELRPVVFRVPNFPPEQADADSLVLTLRLRNVSADVVFSPTDPYFERRWKGLAHGSKPYTFLELGSRRLYGGPLPWDRRKSRQEAETVEGQAYRVLAPGEEITTVVCTDPEDHVADLLAAYHGDLLWRVQVRRGLVRVGTREVPATAVVGVHFRDTDVVKPAA
jgi:hypothetical protein